MVTESAKGRQEKVKNSPCGNLDAFVKSGPHNSEPHHLISPCQLFIFKASTGLITKWWQCHMVPWWHRICARHWLTVGSWKAKRGREKKIA